MSVWLLDVNILISLLDSARPPLIAGHIANPRPASNAPAE
jgi:hypothetical protein